MEAHTTLLYQGHAAKIANQIETLAAPLDPQAADTLRSEATSLETMLAVCVTWSVARTVGSSAAALLRVVLSSSRLGSKAPALNAD